MVILLITHYILISINDGRCSGSDFLCMLLVFNLNIPAMIFALYNFIAIVYILAKKIKQKYYFSIFCIILTVIGTFFTITSLEYISLVSYSILFFVSLYHYLKD